MTRRRLLGRAALLLAAGAALNAGCMTRPVRQDVFQSGETEVFLRSEKRITSTVEKGYDHPVVISPVRLAHILSRIDMRAGAAKGGKRAPAIPTETLFTIAEGVAKALARAGPDQEVIVMSLRKTRRFGVFDRKYLTSLLTFARGEELFVQVSRVDWEIPTRREDRLPEPKLGDHPMSFRLFDGYGMTLVDAQTLAVEWRDPIFERATRTKITATGEVVRKTILMESPPERDLEDSPERADEYFPEGLSASQLRDLADLEDERRSGTLTESQYRARRRKILSSQQ